ncbi:cation diffusion facilitator family transporter [Terribacillus saccharophilus]|uniref:cation diffusion facilitator family transporter n=1 Tax=Terribacillus saccharophilus TaxID=361277 RepID=UPI003D2DBA85
MKEYVSLLRQGSKSAALAAVVNLVIALVKGGAFLLTGNVAMFAETMHSFGDAANQLFVYVGSALSKKAPTERFPGGFGRAVNLVLLGAVLIVGILAYETIREGITHLAHPSESEGLWISITVLALGCILEGFVLLKAMREIAHESESGAKGLAVIPMSFVHVKRAKPATKLVFMEDLVATSGGLVAIIAILIAAYTPFYQAEGIASIIIGAMMFLVVGRVFLDNAAGVIGEADEEMADKIGNILFEDRDVRDVQEMTVVKEGESFHVEATLEIDPTITVADADDIRDRLEAQILEHRGVTDVTIEFDEDDKTQVWKSKE